MSKLVSFAVLLAFIVVIGALFYKVMVGFLVPIFLAAVLVVVFRPVHRYVTIKVRNREHIAAAITTAIILCLVLLPAAFIITTATVQGISLFGKLDTNSISATLAKLQKTQVFKKFLEMKYQDEIWRIINDENALQAVIAETETYEKLIDDTKLDAYSKALTRDFGHLAKAVRSNEESVFEFKYAALFEKCTENLASIRQPIIDKNKAKNSTPPPKIVEADKLEGEELVESSTEKTEAGEEVPDIIEMQSRAADFRSNWDKLKTTIMGGELRAYLQQTANPDHKQQVEISKSVYEFIKPRLLSLTTTSAAFFARLGIGCAILSVSLFFFLYDGPTMIRTIMQLSPLDDEYEQELLLEFDRTSRAVVLAMIFSAIVQGLLAGVGYWAVGMPSLTFLTLLTMMCALVPFVGPFLVWGPVCVYLVIYHENNLYLAIGLAIWGTLVVGTSDNFVKMFVLHGQRQLHPFLALLSVLGGVQALGPIGIIVGPMAVTMLQTLLGILQKELTNFDVNLAKNKKKRRRKRPAGSTSTPAAIPAIEPQPPATGNETPGPTATA